MVCGAQQAGGAAGGGGDRGRVRASAREAGGGGVRARRGAERGWGRVWGGVMRGAAMLVRTLVNARTGPGWQEDRVIRRASSGTGGPCSSRVMVAADR